MAITGSKPRIAVHTPSLTVATTVATALAACAGQVGLAIPAVLNGLFQQDLGTTASQLTWISDAFLVPVALLELTWGVLGDLFGRKRLLIGGSVLLAVGEFVSVLTPGAGTSTGARVGVLWTGQALAGIGAAVLFPTSLAMVAAGTHTVRSRARGIAIWAAALSTGGFISPVLGGLVTKIHWGGDPYAAWRWAFVAVGILALISAGVACTAQNSSAPEGRSLDWPGQITIAIALFALLFAVINAATSGWSDGLVISGFIVAAIFLLLFIAVERRSVNTVPNHLAGMASGTTSQLRDFGFTLGPAVIGAVALSQAAGQIQARVAASARLRAALGTFYRAPAHVPAGQRASVQAAVDAVKSGPLGANGVPATVPGPKGTPVPFNPLKDVAFHALGQAYSLGYLICGVAALVSAVLAAAALHGLAHRPLVTEESLAE